jgi:alkylglycerol monooxygenase
VSSIFIALAIPVFFTLILVEWVISQERGRRVYRFNDAIVDLSCGIGQQMTQVVWAALILAIYTVIYESFALFELSSTSVWTWLFGVLAYDHQYYWWHRVTHRSRLFWTTHVVHHQSEDYNLAVALRQAWFSAWSGIPFYAVLAVAGLPPFVYAICSVTNTLYQFWIHTELVGKLGRWEWVFNTPSHHRVHHAVDPKYIDKNYAGFLIIWDRLYGTFIEEDTAPTYGTVTAHRSWNPVWANVGPLVELWREAAAIPDVRERVRYVLAPPEWRPAELGGPLQIPEPTPGRLTWDARTVPRIEAYVAAHFVLTSVAVTWILAVSGDWSLSTRIAVAVLVIWTTSQWGALFERRAWGVRGEQARLVALLALASIAGSVGAIGTLTWGVLAAIFAGSLIWLSGPGRPPVRVHPVAA